MASDATDESQINEMEDGNDKVSKVSIFSYKFVPYFQVLFLCRWCLYLRHLSSSAYELLRDSGVVKLPSQRTLRDCTH